MHESCMDCCAIQDASCISCKIMHETGKIFSLGTEHNLLICCHCSSLVAMSHKASHSKKCRIHPCLLCPGLLLILFLMLSLVSLMFVSSGVQQSDLSLLKQSRLLLVPYHQHLELWSLITQWSPGLNFFCCLSVSFQVLNLEVVTISLSRLGDLWKLAVSCATLSTHVHQKEVPVRKNMTSAISLAQDGLYGKACQTLTSSGVAPNNPTTWNLLVSKHPSCTCPLVPDTPHTDFKLPSTLNLMAILRSFPKLTAAGPSGLRIQHLIDAAEVPLQTPSYTLFELSLTFWFLVGHRLKLLFSWQGVTSQL